MSLRYSEEINNNMNAYQNFPLRINNRGRVLTQQKKLMSLEKFQSQQKNSNNSPNLVENNQNFHLQKIDVGKIQYQSPKYQKKTIFDLKLGMKTLEIESKVNFRVLGDDSSERIKKQNRQQQAFKLIQLQNMDKLYKARQSNTNMNDQKQVQFQNQANNVINNVNKNSHYFKENNQMRKSPLEVREFDFQKTIKDNRLSQNNRIGTNKKNYNIFLMKRRISENNSQNYYAQFHSLNSTLNNNKNINFQQQTNGSKNNSLEKIIQTAISDENVILQSNNALNQNLITNESIEGCHRLSNNILIKKRQELVNLINGLIRREKQKGNSQKLVKLGPRDAYSPQNNSSSNRQQRIEKIFQIQREKLNFNKSLNKLNFQDENPLILDNNYDQDKQQKILQQQNSKQYYQFQENNSNLIKNEQNSYKSKQIKYKSNKKNISYHYKQSPPKIKQISNAEESLLNKTSFPFSNINFDYLSKKDKKKIHDKVQLAAWNEDNQNFPYPNSQDNSLTYNFFDEINQF